MRERKWVDTLHGFSASCRSRAAAWMVIRAKCQQSGKKAPSILQIVEEEKRKGFDFAVNINPDNQ